MFFDAVEAAEDIREVVRRDSFTVVSDIDFDLASLFTLAASDLNFERFIWVLFDRVFDEVEHHLAPIEAVSLDGEMRFWEFKGDLDALIFDDLV